MKLLTIVIPIVSLLAPVSADDFVVRHGAIISGVMVSDQGGMYTIRVENGVIQLPYTDVFEVISTDLTVEDVQKAENAARPGLQEREQRRRAFMKEERAETATLRQGNMNYYRLQKFQTSRVVAPRHPVFRRYNPVIHYHGHVSRTQGGRFLHHRPR